MATYPYSSALRSSTPPLYYHRPDGAAPSYYTVPTRDLESLRIPPPTDSARSATLPPRLSTHLHPPSVDRSSMQRPPPAAAAPPSPRLSNYAMPAVSNPYGGPATSAAAAAMAPPPAPAAPRWSYQQPPVGAPGYPTVDPLASRAAAMDAEESALAAEEAALRAQLAELQTGRRRQEEEQLFLSHGWAQMLEREERYYTEPLVDRRPDIAAREQQCAMLHDRLQQAEAHAHHAQSQLQATEYIVRDLESFELERRRVQDGFHDIDRRRRECVAKAERYFDVETKRVVEGNKAIRKLDTQLREMTRRGPLAQLQGQSRSPSTHQPLAAASSRMVTFAADKSIVLDLGGDDSVSSAGPFAEEGGSAGMTNTYSSTYASTADTDEGGVGGASIAFSLNDTKEPMMMKRRKVEMATA